MSRHPARLPLHATAVCAAFCPLLSTFYLFASHSLLLASLSALRAIFRTAVRPARRVASRLLL